VAALVANGAAQSFDTVAVDSPTFDSTGANKILVTIAWYTGDAVVVQDVSDNKGNTYALAGAAEFIGNSACGLYETTNTTPTVGSGHQIFAESHNGVGSCYSVLLFQAWSGIDTSGNADAYDGHTANATNTVNTDTVTPTQANDLAVTGLEFEANSGGAVSINHSFTITDTVPQTPGVSVGGSMAYLTNVSSAIDADWNITNNASELATVIGLFKTVAAGAGKPWVYYAAQHQRRQQTRDRWQRRNGVWRPHYPVGRVA